MMFKNGILAALLAVALSAIAVPAVAADDIAVKVGFIRAPHMRETLSILDIPAADDGIAGAKLAIEDNNTTGHFLGQTFAIEDVPLRPDDDPAAALNGLVARGISLFSPISRRPSFSRSPTRPKTRGSSFSTPTRRRICCGRKIAAPMSFTLRLLIPCLPTDLLNISSGSNGNAGS